jgi:hypothetical protein
MLVWKMHFLSHDTPYAGDRPRNTTGGLLTFYSNVAELLAVMALR